MEPKYLTIQYFKQKNNWNVSWMCQQLNISRAGYYKWLQHEKPQEEMENEQIALWIKEYDEKFKHTLGYRRIRNYINRDKDKHYSKRRIQRIMRVLGIKSVIRRQRKPYRHSTPETTAKNILHREFEATKPNEKWGTDVTEFKVPMSNRKIYLSAILDFYDKSVVSYVLSNRNDNKLVFDTYDLALKKNVDATPLFHSDRGYQYTSRVFQNKLKKQGMTQSMSRVSCCIDNGPTEGLWGIIKSEMYYITAFSNEEELRHAIEEYIDYYNNGRYQERFNNLSPTEVRYAALQSDQPMQYPIPENKRIHAYKTELEAKKNKHTA
ncbi:IS3 family transposase [Clostridium lacusfryxellense]|uniref:IS3 family transposase n=1 Tax=Clostridium lacusfryxellense TaxID=205328 RepID=UPI001C0B872D|nr:IS3 family transposase [Clostridium lacusfryxellense]MBU3114855.1 IS3 family transposase [Clostridium lacusfryxellense]